MKIRNIVNKDLSMRQSRDVQTSPSMQPEAEQTPPADPQSEPRPREEAGGLSQAAATGCLGLALLLFAAAIFAVVTLLVFFGSV